MSADPFLPSLLAELARLGEGAAGDLAVAALHFASGRRVLMNEAGHFPPGSAIKLPIALRVLERVDRGEITLDTLVEVRPAEMNPMGPGGLGELFRAPGIALSVRNHLEGMITRSCNTSTDVLIRVAGGMAGVADWVARAGIGDFACTLTMREALCIMHDIPPPEPTVSMVDYLAQMPDEVIDARNRTDARFRHDERDLCEPRAMLELLRRLHARDGVSPAAASVLTDTMTRTVGTRDRIGARLPEGVATATKTGSGAGTAVDVGFVELPAGRGTLALAIFVMGSRRDMATRNRAIADVARLVVDYFIITEAPRP
ncbi:serine hydrolase [Acuticoccus kandeliae]|uniref:serine hydrolase n=1 Tax=Acuticoccus kandeliae TaxID=2073160 RepID=UPI000D3E795B|nr:serine hydrolase [Acuticoccus kandeliae]